MKREIWVILCAILLVGGIIVSFLLTQPNEPAAQIIAIVSSSDEYPKTQTEPYQPIESDEELRAVWVPYMTLNGVTEEKIHEIVDNAEKYGYNAIIFHVRPFSDALYESDFFPTSHYIAGEQGGAADFDPLVCVIEAAHARGIAVHAWINPLRIQHNNGNVPPALSADNPYNIWRNDDNAENDDYVVDYMSGKYMNPAYEEVRALIVDGIAEIVERYDVDGIHWDDYFYPANDDSFDDSRAYESYLQSDGELTLVQWRQENINTLVRDSYAAIKSIDSSVVFGISPAGNINNCLNAGADVYLWGSKEGYVDYLCPQIYWSFDHPTAPYDTMCLKWRQVVTNENVRLYIGLALYKAGTDSDSGTWLSSDRILADEVLYARENIAADGFMIYSYDYLTGAQTQKEVENLTEALLGTKSPSDS